MLYIHRPFPGVINSGRPRAHRPPPRARRAIPYVFFHDNDYDHDIVDLDDLLDNDIDTGQAMVALPSNWTDLTLRDVNDGKPGYSQLCPKANLILTLTLNLNRKHKPNCWEGVQLGKS